MERFDYLVRQNIGDPGSTKLRNFLLLISDLPKLPQLRNGVNKNNFVMSPYFSRLKNNKNLSQRQPGPESPA